MVQTAVVGKGCITFSRGRGTAAPLSTIFNGNGQAGVSCRFLEICLLHHDQIDFMRDGGTWGPRFTIFILASSGGLLNV